MRTILLNEYATQTILSVAEAVAQTEANDVFDLYGALSPIRDDSSESKTLSHMSPPENYRINTPLRTRENSPLITPFRTHIDEAETAEEMIQGNDEAELAGQLAN